MVDNVFNNPVMNESFIVFSRGVCFLFRVTWAESGELWRHETSQAVSLWVAQDAYAPNIVHPRVGKGKALVKNRGDDMAYRVD